MPPLASKSLPIYIGKKPTTYLIQGSSSTIATPSPWERVGERPSGWEGLVPTEINYNRHFLNGMICIIIDRYYVEFIAGILCQVIRRD